MKKEKIKNATTFDELLDIKYGKIGTEKRDVFEEKAQYFVISEMLKEARKEGVRIYTVGIGRPEGEPIPVIDASGKVTGYRKDKNGQTVMSKLDEMLLQKIALETDGKYFRATGTDIELDRIYNDISGMEKKELKSTTYVKYENRYQYFAVIAFLLLIAEILISERKKAWVPWKK